MAEEYSYKVILATIGETKTVGRNSYDLCDVMPSNQNGWFRYKSNAKARLLLTSEYLLLFIHDDIFFIDCLRFKSTRSTNSTFIWLYLVPEA